MKSDSLIEKTNSSESAEAASGNETPSRLSGAVFFVLCATLIFSTLAFGAVDVGALGILVLISCLIAILWLTDAWLKKDFGFNTSGLQISVLGLILIGAIQLLPLRLAPISGDLLSIPAAASLSLAPFSTRLEIVQLIVYFIFLSAALFFINNRSRLRKIVLTVIIFGSLMAFFGIMQKFVNAEAIYGLRLPNQANPFGSFVNGHHFAAFMEMTAGLTLGLLFSRWTKNNKGIFLLIALVVMGMAILFTSSRGGLISFLGVVGFVVTANILQKSSDKTPSANGKNYRRNFSYIGGGLALIIILFGAVLFFGGDDALLRGIGLSNPDDPSSGRFHFWYVAWQIFLDYPVIGAGLDSFGMAFTRYDTWNGFYRVEQAHNDYLQILAESGILGFACAVWFIYLLFKKGWRIAGESSDPFRRGAAIGALAGCFGILIHSFFDFPLRTTSNALFFLTLTVIATAPIASSTPARKKRLTTRLDD